MTDVTLPTHARFRNLTGQTIGRLTIVSFAGMLPMDKQNGAHWNCQCSCGNAALVSSHDLLVAMRTANLGTRSCGCLMRETSAANGRATARHGEKGTMLHNIWVSMRQRCNDSNCNAFKWYGARGITVCDRWLTSYENFRDDMGYPPSKKHSIDRIDVHGPYSPENCRWATDAEQARNRTNNRIVTFRGQSKTVVEWSEITGIRYGLLMTRLDAGWDPERAFTQPPGDPWKNRRSSRTTKDTRTTDPPANLP